MRDANRRYRGLEPTIPAGMLESVHDLNHRFLELIGVGADKSNSANRPNLSTTVSEQVAPLSALQKKAAAECPYALFDLRFHDERYWQVRLQGAAAWSVADNACIDENTVNFVRLALFFAWHVAATDRLAAQLLLGMSESTAAAFRGVTIDWLPALVATESMNLTARWSGCAAYWCALTGAASRPNSAGLRRIQLYGLQLAAAVRLT